MGGIYYPGTGGGGSPFPHDIVVDNVTAFPVTIGNGPGLTPASNLVFGNSANGVNVYGIYQMAFGGGALAASVYGQNDIAIGLYSQFSNIGGISNVSVGLQSLGALQTPHGIVATVSNNAGTARFNAASTATLSVGANVQLAGFTLYGGKRVVSNILANTWFETGDAFAGNDTGEWLSLDAGHENTAVGGNCGGTLVTGSRNSYFGATPGAAVESGTTKIGFRSGTFAPFAGPDNNIAFSNGVTDELWYDWALSSWYSPDPIKAEGALALQLKTGPANRTTALGANALNAVVFSASNTAIGADALGALTSSDGMFTAVQDNGFGFAQFLTATTPGMGAIVYCAVISGAGPYAGIAAVTAVNAGVSFDTMQAFAGTASDYWLNLLSETANTALGDSAGAGLIDGVDNTFAGVGAGATQTHASGNTLLGIFSGSSLPANVQNAIVLSNGQGDRILFDEASQNMGIGAAVLKVPYVLGQANGLSIVGVALTFIGPYVLSSESLGTRTGITGLGAHGLTAANSVGKGLGVLSGVGWTPNSLPIINSLDANTVGVKIIVDVPYNVGMASPVVALAGTGVTYPIGTLPGNSLGKRGSMRSTFYWRTNAPASYATMNLLLGGHIYGQDGSNAPSNFAGKYLIANQGNPAVQVSYPQYNYVDGSFGGVEQTFAIDTTLPQLHEMQILAADVDSYICIFEMTTTVHPS